MAKITHNLIAKTAREIACEAYESIAHDNTFYEEWPTMAEFVEANWVMFVDGARSALMQIIAGDYPDAMKQPIYEALLLDGAAKGDPNSPNRATRRKMAAMSLN